MLYKKLLPASIAGAALLASASAFADIEISIDSVAGSVGGTVVVTYDYSALDADDVGGFQFDINYDPSSLTPTDVTTCGNNAPATHVGSCTEPGGAGNGTIRTIIADFVPPTQEIAPTAIAPFGQFTFQIDQPGTHTLTFAGPVGSDIAGGNVVMTGTDGAITGTITGASGYASVPAIGETIDLGSALIGEVADATATDITVSEIGDQTLNVTALTVSGADAGDFASATAPFSIADGGADVPVDLNCTPSARGVRNAQIVLTNDSVNAGAPVYPLTCAGLGPNVQVAPSTIDLNGLTTDPSGPTGTITATNPNSDGFTAPATVMASVSVPPVRGGPSLSVAPMGPQPLAVDGSVEFTVTCDNSFPGNITRDILIEWTDENGGNGDSDTVTVSCEILDEFPEYSSAPPDGTPVDFMVVTNGTTSAAVPVDVFNTGNGTGPASELFIDAGATAITGADAAAFDVVVTNTNAIPVTGNPDGNTDFEITCTPPAGSDGVTLTALLTVVSNADNSPATHELSCEGATDAFFGSSPADGGTLNLGVVPPVATTPPGAIVFDNTGAVDELSVECDLTDPDGVFTATPDPIALTIGPGASDDAQFQCTPPSPGFFQATVECAVNGASNTTFASYTVTCQGQPLVVPTLDRWGLLIMVLALLAVGGFAGRRMMA